MVDPGVVVVTILNGLTNGMLLFLVAVGLTLIFGVMDVLNFAHGSFYMLGAYTMYFLVRSDGILAGVPGQFWFGLIIAALVVAVVGAAIERLIIRPIYGADHVFQLLLTFALILVIDNLARIFWGTEFRSVSVPDIFQFQFDLFGQGYPAYNLFLIVMGGLVAVTMWLIFERTRVGKMVRAASQDREMANALGINVPLLFTAMFLVGSLLAGFGGALAAPYTSIYPSVGETIIISAFIVVVVGGLGSFTGALVGALLIGLLESFMFYLLPPAQPIIAFVLMAIVLLALPSGLFGVDTA